MPVKKRKFKYGIFDRDGVLIDTYSGFENIFARVAKEMGFNLGAAFLKKIDMTPWLETLKVYLPESQHQLIPEFIKRYHQAGQELAQQAQVYEPVPKILKDLKQRGLRLFVSSMAQQKQVEDSIKFTQLDPYFDLMIGNRNALKIADKNEHIRIIVSYLKTSSKVFSASAFFVGDMPYDMEIAKKNEVFAIGITTTVNRSSLEAAGADVVIDKHEQLLDLIKS